MPASDGWYVMLEPVSLALWLLDYNASARLGQDTMEIINECHRHQKSSAEYAKLSAQIRTSIRSLSTNIEKLREQLLRAGTHFKITQREIERREAMLDQLISKHQQLEHAFKNRQSASDRDRSALLDDVGAAFRNDPWDSSPSTREMQSADDFTFQEIRQQQASVLQEQDQGLEVLSNVIGRQKQMALDIGNEVDYQNELLDDITDHVDRTDERLLRETHHIRIVDKKSSTCALWIVAGLLFVAIVVVILVPFHGKF